MPVSATWPPAFPCAKLFEKLSSNCCQRQRPARLTVRL